MNRALELKFLSWRIMRRRSQGLLGTTTSSKDLEDPWRMLHVRGLTAHGVRRAQRYQVRVAGTSMPAISIQKARKDASTLIVDPAYQAVRNCFEAPVLWIQHRNVPQANSRKKTLVRGTSHQGHEMPERAVLHVSSPYSATIPPSRSSLAIALLESLAHLSTTAMCKNKCLAPVLKGI